MIKMLGSIKKWVAAKENKVFTKKVGKIVLWIILAFVVLAMFAQLVLR